jgi:hypothetical protein
MLENPDIGRVFTPLKWSMWLLEQIDALHYWRDGATILDPTFGGGSFIIALLELAKKNDVEVTTNLISRIFGYEINASDKPRLFKHVFDNYHVSLHDENFMTGDVLCSTFQHKFDLLVGNPPWANFSILPKKYKNLWADKYIEYGLVKNRKDVLLGGSRADIATLILKKILDDNIVSGGKSAFFLPLSIFFNSGSNDLFRPYPGSKHGYSVDELWDFADEKIFLGVATRYGAAKITKSSEQKWPVTTHVRDRGDWYEVASTPSDGQNGFWQRHQPGTKSSFYNPQIPVLEGQQPRQGLNTCGANDVLIFTKYNNLFKNIRGELVDIEDDLLMPLMDKSTFSNNISKHRYILVPHNKKTGRPFTEP